MVERERTERKVQLGILQRQSDNVSLAIFNSAGNALLGGIRFGCTDHFICCIHSDNPQTWAPLGARRENQQQTYVLASS